MSDTRFLTREGYAKLEQELHYLRTVKRAEIADQIRIAKEDGDVSENAGYETAKLEQAFLEGRIIALEEILKRAEIIDSTQFSGAVMLGSTVVVQEDTYDPETFQLVGSDEANPTEGRISNESPLGKMLLGRRVGDTVQVSTPNGVTVFKVLEIR